MSVTKEAAPNGVRCPKCLAKAFVRRLYHPAPGLTIRYLECRACRRRFRSKEVIG